MTWESGQTAVSVVVVTHESAADITGCLASIGSGPVGSGPVGSGPVGSVVVVDSASTDATVRLARAAGVPTIALRENVGFGSACNRGAAETTGTYVFFLNPDTVLDPACVSQLAARLDRDPAVVAVGPVVRNPDGSIYPSSRQFPSLLTAALHGFLGPVLPRNRWSQRYLRPTGVEWISGTALMVRRDVFEQVGGFDERYFMYVEDVDLCWRLRPFGGVAVVSSAGLVHRIGGSSGKRPIRMIVAHHRSLFRFASRSTSGPARLSLPFVAVGLAARAALSGLRFVRNPVAPATLHGNEPASK
jgi:N-acetylglucosaminyl-diphospho-decaprenol L-rhamnosyltransferase